MANFIEKRLPKAIRERMSTAIIAALSLFLALQYNETIISIMERVFPLDGNGLLGRIITVLMLTILVVYAIYYVETGLDGK